ncbi:hypothetical protein ANANG_G00033750 [Anguilla anguilla]|uniref:Uncharacterized protein n=1 Tax=Anguilla anguilla TaxID=7936 RepID=A0A9D3S6Z4_ANGAN|nr:hypothetical protein ANANG_G00033750 [Anguilla anguilla]
MPFGYRKGPSSGQLEAVLTLWVSGYVYQGFFFFFFFFFNIYLFIYLFLIFYFILFVMLKAMPTCMALASINQIYLYSVFYGSCHNAFYGQP